MPRVVISFHDIMRLGFKIVSDLHERGTYIE